MRLIFLSRSLCHFVSLFLFLFQSGQLSLLFNSICRNECDRHLLSIIFFVWISINRLFIGIIQTFDTSSFIARLMDFPVHFLFRIKKEKKIDSTSGRKRNFVCDYWFNGHQKPLELCVHEKEKAEHWP